ALRSSPSYPYFKLSATRTLATIPATAATEDSKYIAGHADFLAAALATTPTDVTALALSILPRDPDNPEPENHRRLTFENIELLYGATAFARSLGLSPSEFLRWQRLLDPVAPFKSKGADRAGALLGFADSVALARASGKTLEELEYLLLDARG